jgi:uncharacterized protein (TIGR02271 family)
MTSDSDEVRKPGDIRDTIIPLYGEDLSVSKRQVVTGRVRVETVTREHEQLVDAQLARERVEVERVAIGKLIDAIPAVRQEGNTTIIPVVEEVLVVERRLVLKEEIHIHRVRTTEQHQERVTLRQQEAVITRLPIETTPGETSSVSDSDPGDNVSSKE